MDQLIVHRKEKTTHAFFFLLSARLTETVPEITKSLPVPSSPPAAPPPPSSPPLPPQPPGLLPSPSALRASHVNSLHAHILFGAIRKREPFPACHIASCHHQLIHQLPPPVRSQGRESEREILMPDPDRGERNRSWPRITHGIQL